MIVAVAALIASVGGSALAVSKQRPDKKSVGARQLKPKAVKRSKIANNAVNGRKVRNASLSGEDIDLDALGTVPSATAAAAAGNVSTVTGHGASCPAGTTLIRGTCFDSASNPPTGSVKQAADGCAAKGGFLPSPVELYMARGVLNLGAGAPDAQFADAYYSNTAGSGYRTVVVSESGMKEHPIESPAEYTCAYPLVR
jgi:hypothetical protein